MRLTDFSRLSLLIACASMAGCGSSTSSLPKDSLITGKYIAARPAQTQDVGSLPMNLILTPDGKYALSTDMGYYQSLWSVRVSDNQGVSHVDFPNSRNMPGTQAPVPLGEVPAPPVPKTASKTNGLYYGLAISPDGTLYAAQGGHDAIALLSLDSAGRLTLNDSIRTRSNDFPAGLALDSRGLLYVSNNAATESGANPPGSVAIYDPHAKKELGRYTFSDSHGGTSNFPLGLTTLADGSKTYVASERDDAVYVLDTHDPAHPGFLARLETGAHPVCVLLSRDQHRLYVANSLSDTISVVDTAADRILSTILLRPHMARDIPGVSPVSLALSPDQKTLYAALGDMNAVAVVDLASAELRGYVPTGWYPSALAVTPDGKRLLVANAKGHDVRNPNTGLDRHNPQRKAVTHTVLEGNVSSIDIPSREKLASLTEQVIRFNRLNSLIQPAANPLASIGLSSGKITHVIYVIKENRTYDQILSDLPQGNGDPTRLLFGRDVTPNQHALAERFVLLDNLYACGEVSGDGWDWSTQGMADAYVIRNVPYNYSGRGRRFDEEGENNGSPSGGSSKHKPIPDVASTRRNIWDIARAGGLSLRNYGFFTSDLENGSDNSPTAPGLLPGGHDLAGITNVDYRHFDMDYPDSDAPAFYYAQTRDPACLFAMTRFGRAKSPSRFSEWNREFQLMLKKDPTGKSVPNLMLVRLPTDHTVGAKSGKHTPRSYLADNDYGVGQIVEAVSKSPIWPHCAIFVIEDDAQAGIDHVDAHRMTGFVISPWIKKSSVDHHFHNTDSVLKTIELLLGLPPLCQYDAVADPIMDWDSAPSNAAPFFAIMPPKSIIAETSPVASALPHGDPRRSLAERSDRMNFTREDAAPARELDEITWQTIRGVGSPIPLTHGLSLSDQDDDD